MSKIRQYQKIFTKFIEESILHIDNMKSIDCQTSYETGGIIYEENISS